MLFDDTYNTLQQPAESVFTDRGSKFTGIAFPVRTEAEFKQQLAGIKAGHPKAAHHCWAWRLTPDRSIFKVNDDGEPSGTAGRPILNTLLSKDITNIGMVVVRYFGGTLLGVPGLINAYKTTTEQTLAAAKIVQQSITDVYTIIFDYQQMNTIMRLIKDEQLEVIKQSFDNTSSVQVAIRKTQVNTILQKLSNLTGVSTTYNYTM
ncbi:IMPACT family protein [Mucilaginibacter sp.]